MKNLYLAQVNYKYGNNVFLPYSVGRLWAAAKQFPIVKDNYVLKELLFLREDIFTVVDRMEEPYVLGISCYIWNWAYSMALAVAVKEKYPQCFVVIGGPQIPDDPSSVLRDYPSVDVCMHGEGEMSFMKLLVHKITGGSFSSVLSASYRTLYGVRIGVSHRTADLDSLPSPYLEGVFDKLMHRYPYDFHASQETHRGCPYSCSFCDWGSATFQKVSKFGSDRIAAEIEWFADNQIDLLYNCDANFGMLKRDVRVAELLVSSKEKCGYPNKFRAAWAKKQTDTVFRAADILNRAGMQKGVTIALQSMDGKVLENIKRKNIAVENLSGLIHHYRQLDIPTYAEVILGLPGESFLSFVEGINNLMECGQHDAISVYCCVELVNSEMAKPGYKHEYGIKTREVPIMLLHGSPEDNDITETYRLVTETSNMPHREWVNAYLFSWMVQAFHCLPVTQHIVRSLVMLDSKNVGYDVFYCSMLLYFKQFPDTMIGREITEIEKMLGEVLNGGSWNAVVDGCGEITWPPDEASYLRLMQDDLDLLYDEIAAFVAYFCVKVGADLSTSVLDEIVEQQRHAVGNPFQKSGVVITPMGGVVVKFDDEYNGDIERWAREAVWYGRKGNNSLLGKITVI